MQRIQFLTAAFVICLSSFVPAQGQSCSGMSLGQGAEPEWICTIPGG